MASGLVDIMKRAAMDAVDNAKLSDLRFGTVISESPLKVKITNQFILTEQMLIVPQYLTDHEVDVTITNDYGWKDTENNSITVTKQKMKIHGGLKTGDKVALMRKQGGQSYFILDRIK